MLIYHSISSRFHNSLPHLAEINMGTILFVRFGFACDFVLQQLELALIKEGQGSNWQPDTDS